MMFGQGGPVKVFVATRPVRLPQRDRRFVTGGAGDVRARPVLRAVFVGSIVNAGNRIKLLMWDQTACAGSTSGWRTAVRLAARVQDGVMPHGPPRRWRRLFEGFDWRAGAARAGAASADFAG